MKVLKVLYALSFMACLIQLMFWLFMPFIGGVAMVKMVSGEGFYPTSPERLNAISENWGISAGTFGVINQIVAIIYFITLVVPVLSILFLKKFNKRSIYITVSCLFALNILILFSLWLQKFM
ncbi:hypothetical protein [Sphingobacterium sp. HMA12]|uniref:hypothetical protein n=1 Tax=Sphingobacterium sp. HMA12 TaxID=2050894 RepID=UPI0013158A99|nr:hypothetical protein [Sphingobacterium sp. HMA12]